VGQLTGDAHPLGRRPTGELALRAQPGHQVEGAVGGVLARLVEAAQPFGEHRLQTIFHGAGLDQTLTEPGALHPAQLGSVFVNGGDGSGASALQTIGGCGHSRSMKDGCDSCLS